MAQIRFINDNVEMPRFVQSAVIQWIEQVCAAHQRTVGDLAYIFCDDEKILAVNQQYLQHDYFTDIITFDYSTRRRVSGDMFISLQTVASNAELFGREYNEELLRVVIHGVLHLCGINDKGPGEREVMERHENEALAMLKTPIFNEEA